MGASVEEFVPVDITAGFHHHIGEKPLGCWKEQSEVGRGRTPEVNQCILWCKIRMMSQLQQMMT